MEQNKEIQTVDSTTEVLNTDAASTKIAAMMEFVKRNLKKGNDYMSIGGGKPTLLKSGAEKMNILMGYCAEYDKMKEIINPKDSFYYVEVKCVLTNRDGRKVAEGLASCNNQEKNRKNVPFADSLNTVLKMAEKRAYVGATLNANALSQFYTQDLEDNTVEQKKDEKGAILSCVGCGIEVSQKVATFSAEKMGKILCFKCQKKDEEQRQEGLVAEVVM